MYSLSQIESLYATEMGNIGDLRITWFGLYGTNRDNSIRTTNGGKQGGQRIVGGRRISFHRNEWDPYAYCGGRVRRPASVICSRLAGILVLMADTKFPRSLPPVIES